MGKKIIISFPGGRGYEIPLLYFTSKHFEDLGYESVIFIAKSIGTVVACKIKEMYKIPASLILFTPLNDTLPYINNKNDIHFVSAGENDRYLDSKTLRELCKKESIKCYIEPNVGHRMEVKGGFPDGNSPYEIMTRLLEECGEVAAEVNHFENSGTKRLRNGEPSKEKLAGEVRDVLNAVMQLIIYYDVEEEVNQAIETSISRLTAEGHI